LYDFIAIEYLYYLSKELTYCIAVQTKASHATYRKRDLMSTVCCWVQRGLRDAGCALRGMKDAGCWILDAGYWMLDVARDAGCVLRGMKDARCRMLDTGCSAGCGMRVAGDE